MSSFVLKNIKFFKFDKFDNPVFIANNTKDPENFKILKDVYDKVKLIGIDTFLPLYYNETYDYMTVMFKSNTSKSSFSNDYLFNITFELRVLKKDQKKFINCVIKKFQRGESVAQIGEILDLSM